jgi:predicted O-linked N-acetylglucosamine transferase (SPINDLY family)
MTYLGFPGTLGLPFIDYLIADPRIIPTEQQKHYAEKILYLPHCYLPRDTSVAPSPITPKRSDFGLPEEGFVFCSFNHDYKINPPMFKIWMDLLKEVPGSVLWLMKLNEAAQENLLQSAKKHGVNPERIVFALRLPMIEDHLARYQLVDLFLDTFPYNGHTTAGDALSAGTPVISICGLSFASRVASSLLYDLRLDSLVCNNLQTYFNKSLHLAKDHKLLSNHRELLLHKVNSAAWPPTPRTQVEAFKNLLEFI